MCGELKVYPNLAAYAKDGANLLRQFRLVTLVSEDSAGVGVRCFGKFEKEIELPKEDGIVLASQTDHLMASKADHVVASGADTILFSDVYKYLPVKNLYPFYKSGSPDFEYIKADLASKVLSQDDFDFLLSVGEEDFINLFKIPRRELDDPIVQVFLKNQNDAFVLKFLQDNDLHFKNPINYSIFYALGMKKTFFHSLSKVGIYNITNIMPLLLNLPLTEEDAQQMVSLLREASPSLNYSTVRHIKIVQTPLGKKLLENISTFMLSEDIKKLL